MPLLAVALAHGDVILLSTDFNNATLGEYANNAVINSTGASYEQLTAIKSAPGVGAIGTNQVGIYEYTPGNRVLEVNTTNIIGGTITLRKVIDSNSLSMNSKGNNFLEGRFDLTFYHTSAVGTPQIYFSLVNGSDNNPIDTSPSLLIFRVSAKANSNKARFFRLNYPPSGVESPYPTGWPEVGSDQNPLLETNVPYRFYFCLDMSDGAGNMPYDFKIVNLNNDTVVCEFKQNYGRNQNFKPSRFFIYSPNPSGASLDPRFHVDNIHITARNKIFPSLLLIK